MWVHVRTTSVRRFHRVPTINVLSKSKKNNITMFHLKIIIFTAVIYCSILHGCVCVMLWGFFRRLRAANSTVRDPIRLKFELVRALMHAIVTCKYEKERMKTAEISEDTVFFHHNPICYHGNQWLDLAEFQTHPSSHVCKYERI